MYCKLAHLYVVMDGIESILTGDFEKKVGAAIRRRRLFLKYSQEQLSRKCGLSRGYISKVESGAYRITLESCLKIIHALHWNVCALVDEL